jgi:DNA polymerase III delta prime subunit
MALPDTIREPLERWMENKYMPDCIIFAGPTGCGKTTVAYIFGSNILGEDIHPGYRSDRWWELNAAHDRGIDVAADLDNYASEPGRGGFKIVFLDEGESGTSAAQASLRATIEKRARNCKWIICTNEPEKVTPALHSRSAIFYFPPVPV